MYQWIYIFVLLMDVLFVAGSRKPSANFGLEAETVGQKNPQDCLIMQCKKKLVCVVNGFVLCTSEEVRH